MKILLILPPFERLKGSVMSSFPIGLGYIATSLNDAGYQVNIYNADLGKKELNSSRTIYSRTLDQDKYAEAIEGKSYVWDEIGTVLKDYNPDILGIHINSTTLASGLRTAKIAKEVLPNVLTAFGGPHTTINPDDVIKYPQADFAIRCEGEEAVVELVNTIDKKICDYKNIKNLSFKDKNGTPVHNSEREPIKNLDSLPIINRDLMLFREEYPDNIISNNISGSRGCPYRCTFCAIVPLWGNLVRYRSVENIMLEIKELIGKYSMNYFYFNDDTFTSSKKNVVELCNALISSGYSLRWTCQARVNTLDENIIKLLKRAGCSEIQLGVESGSNRILKAIKKGITVQQIKDVVKLIKRNKISLTTYFMVGIPQETEDDIIDTIKLIKELNPNHSNLSTFTPYPGTELHDYLVSKGKLKGFDWARNYEISHHSLHNNFNLNIEKGRFKELVIEALKVVEEVNRDRFTKKFKMLWRNKYYYIRNIHIYFPKLIKIIINKLTKGGTH